MILTFLSLPTDDQLGHSNSDSDGGVGPPECALQSGCQCRLQYANHNTQIPEVLLFVFVCSNDNISRTKFQKCGLAVVSRRISVINLTSLSQLTE